MSELKYKVGDKFFVEVEIEAVEDSGGSRSYLLKSNLLYNSIWKTKSLVDSLLEANKPLDCMRPQVTQKVMDWYEKHKDSDWNMWDYLKHVPEELEDWFFYTEDNLKNQHALATLIAYGPEAVEVIKEKRYKVRIPNEGMGPDYLVKGSGGQIFLAQKGFFDDLRYELTEEEIKRNHEPLWGTEWVKEVE